MVKSGCFLHSTLWVFWAEIECVVHVVTSLNQFSKADNMYPNILMYTVTQSLLLLQNYDYQD